MLVQACNIPIKTTAPSGASNISSTTQVTVTQPLPAETSTPSMITKDGATLVYVPKGSFTMGNNADNAFTECQKISSGCKRDWFTREEPVHNVTLDSFGSTKPKLPMPCMQSA